MVAKISRGESLYGALIYNQKKLDERSARIIADHKMVGDIRNSGENVMQKAIFSFEDYLSANRNTAKPILHISLNPSPEDNLTDAQFGNLARDYMEAMGYGDQPYIVYLHEDTGRRHIHIATTCVDENGKKINDKYEYRRSMQACRALEEKYGLKNAADSKLMVIEPYLKKVDYKQGDVKRQIANTLKSVLSTYKFQSFGEYSALLACFNIEVKQVKGEYEGTSYTGIVYTAINEKGEAVGIPFKSSLLGKQFGHEALTKKMNRHALDFKNKKWKPKIQDTVKLAMQTCGGKQKNFDKILKNKGIDVLNRKNEDGRIYGVTFIDHSSHESFQQETRLMENEYSVNLPTSFYYRGRWNAGWINVVNPFRVSTVLGTPGSGKSYAIVNNYIKQMINKGFAIYIYDYKFDDLSTIAYNELLKNLNKYDVPPQFFVINFDDPRRSHRCNPIAPEFMTDISDAYESAYTIMLNLNRTWIQKQGDFFVESPIILLASIIWYLKIYKDGKYCTFPHAIEFLNKPYENIFTILTSYPALENYLSPFMDAWKGNAQDQLQGQIASAKIPLSRMISPQLYWVMTGDDFTLDINNPKEPKILCVGNNPDRQNIYSAALGLYNSRIVKLINKKGQLKSAVIIDELPTIYFRGLDNLIATARSNKVAVCLGFQDYSQLNRDYGDKESKVIQNTVGNIFSGQVVGETAKNLSERFGKVLQRRQSISINRQDTSTSINTQMDSLIPASKIANLSQGMFVGAVSDNFGEKIDQKIFHAQIVIDNERVAAETKVYEKIPVINDFLDDEGNDIVPQQIQYNYDRIKVEVMEIIEEEMERIANDPNLKHLIGGKEEDR